MSDTDEAEKVKVLKERLRAIGFICAAALAEPDEVTSQKFSGLAERLLDKFLVTLAPNEEDRNTITDEVEDFAKRAYEEMQL
jgi:hypothetical protein